MKHAPESNTKTYQVTPTCTAIEYPDGDNDIWGAVIKIHGRYPLAGYTVNEKCKELAYIISGNGKVIIDGKTTILNQGDQLIINPGERFAWEGNMTMFMPCTPAWYSEQHKEVE